MDRLFNVEWAELVTPTHSIAEMIVRGTLMYLALFVILRFVMKRQAGSLGIADILVIVVIADAAQNGFAKEYTSLVEGITLVLTIVLLDYLIDWAAYHVPALGRILEPPPLNLIKDGRMLRRNMRQELVTVDELESQLRKQGVDDMRKVKSAHMEPDGEISVIRNDEGADQPRSATKAGAK